MNDGAIVYYNENITCCFYAFSAVTDPDLKRRRPNHPDPEINGGWGGGVGVKTFFRPFWPHFGLKIGGGPPGPLPRICHCPVSCFSFVLFCVFYFPSVIYSGGKKIGLWPGQQLSTSITKKYQLVRLIETSLKFTQIIRILVLLTPLGCHPISFFCCVICKNAQTYYHSYVITTGATDMFCHKNALLLYFLMKQVSFPRTIH